MFETKTRDYTRVFVLSKKLPGNLRILHTICTLARIAMKNKHKFQNVEIRKLPKSEVEIEAEITAEALDEARKTSIKELMQTVEIPGFRVGHAPENVLVKNIGEMKILERAASILLDTEYGNIIGEHDIKAIGMPKITITKLAPGNPMGFKAVTAVLPEVSLDTYTKISKEELAKKTEEVTVEDTEVESVIEDIKKRAQQASEASDVSETGGADAGKFEFTDDFARSLGDFKDVADFKVKIRENILEHKKNQAREKKRLAIVERMIAEAAIDLPELLVQSELDTMLNQLKADIEKAGLTYEGYLSQIQKKEDDIRKEWRKNAENKASLQLILHHIARKENIKPDEEKVKKEMDHILSHHKDADRFRLRMYVENLMTNEAVFQFLESSSPKGTEKKA